MPEAIVQPTITELTHTQKVDHVMATAMPLCIEKNKLSPLTNGRSLEDITQQLRLGNILSKPDMALQDHGVSVDPHLSAFKKGEIITALAAATFLKDAPNPEGQKAAALLLATSYPIQAEIRATVATARLQDNAAGTNADMKLVREKGGAILARQVQTGNVDRLLASTVVIMAETKGLSITDTVELARALSTGQPPGKTEIAALVQQAQTVTDIAKTLRNAQPRTGLKPEDVPFHRFSRAALTVYEQTQVLQNPTERQAFLQKLVESGKIPESIKSLQDIISIVDQNPDIRAVSFDLYDTLVQWTEDFVDRYDRYPPRVLKHVRAAGINISEDQLKQINGSVWQDRWTNFQAHGNEMPLAATMDEFVNRLTAGQTVTPQTREQLHALLTREWYSLELENAVVMPGARETLAELKKRGIKICLTSNASWSQAHIRRVLNRFGLYEYFDAVSISSDIGKMKKPNMSEFFHYSWDKLGLPHGAILHVGDNANDDVVGARNAGAKAAHYHNPLAYNRLEVDKVHGGLKFMREDNPQLYAETVVHMQRQSLESTAAEWVKSQIDLRDIPPAERERVYALAKDMYRRSRDIFAPVYVSMGDYLLRQINEGRADYVLGLARDGLPHVIVMKLLRALEPDRYAHVAQDQVRYVYPKREMTRRVLEGTSPEDQQFKDRYLRYLRRKGDFQGKRVLLTDIGTVNTHNFFKRVLIELLGASDVQGIYVDTPGPTPERHSFLQESLGVDELLLAVDTPLLLLEAIYSGPKESVTDFNEKTGPISTSKTIPAEALIRGLSEPSVLLLNSVAIRGLMDAVHVRHRARLAGLPDPSNQAIAQQFAKFLNDYSGPPQDDLIASIPWQEKKGQWSLPKKNPLVPK